MMKLTSMLAVLIVTPLLLAADQQPDGPGTLQAPVRSEPEFQVPAAELFAASLALTSQDKTVGVSAQPLRIAMPHTRPAWGWGVQASYESDKKITSIGTSYRLQWRWILQQWVVDTTDSVHARIVKLDPPSDIEVPKSVWYERETWKQVDTITNLIPVLTLGYQKGFFGTDLSVQDQEDTARSTRQLGLSWRYGNYVSVEGSFADNDERASSTLGTPKVDTRSKSATALAVIAPALGVKWYDEHYWTEGFQRGLGLGVSWTEKDCRESGARRATCADQVLRDRTLGAVLDLRINKKLVPRFTIGRRHLTKFVSGTEEKSSRMEASLILSLTIQDKGQK